MPADTSLSQEPSGKHGDASKPYPCSMRDKPPGAAWSIDYGYCRNSLDLHPDHYKQGSSDPRCPTDCRHKAPHAVAVQFAKQFRWSGAVRAAAAAKAHHDKHRSGNAKA